MIEHQSRKRLSHAFNRLHVDGKNLRRIGQYFESVGEKYGVKPTFEVYSSGGADTVKTHEPEFFVSDSMPVAPDHVHMFIGRYDRKKSSFTVFMSLQFRQARWRDSFCGGADAEMVVGIFHETRKIVERYEAYIKDGVFGRALHFAHSVVFVLCLWASYSVIALLHIYWLDNAHSTADSFVDVAIIILMAILIASHINPTITKLFPKVKFAGELADGNSKHGRWAKWAFIGIVLPIMLNVFSGYIKEMIDFVIGSR